MADINIEKKNNKPVWPWILGLLVLLGIGWVLYEVMDRDDPAKGVAVVEQPAPIIEEPITGSPENSNSQNQAVQDYVTFANNNEGQMGLEHNYTAEGLNKLADALESVSKEQNIKTENLDQNLEKLRNKAKFIQKDPMSLKHADSIKSAFTTATVVFEQIQEQKFPEMQSKVDQLKDAASQLKNNEQTLNQKEEVNNFFNQSSEALESFAANTENQK